MNLNPAYEVLIQSVNTRDPKNAVIVRAPMPREFMFDTSSAYEAPFTRGLTGNSMIDSVVKLAGNFRLVNQVASMQVWQGSQETELGMELEFHAIQDPFQEVRKPVVDLMKLVTPSTVGGTMWGALRSPGPKLDSLFKEAAAAGLDVMSEATGFDIGSLFGMPRESGDIPEAAKVRTSNASDPTQTFTQASDTPAQAQEAQNTSTFGTRESVLQKIDDQISIRVGNIAFFDSCVITHVQKTYEALIDEQFGEPLYARVAIRFKPLFMIIQSDLDRIFAPPNPTPRQGTTGIVPDLSTPGFNPTASYDLRTPGFNPAPDSGVETFPVT